MRSKSIRKETDRQGGYFLSAVNLVLIVVLLVVLLFSLRLLNKSGPSEVRYSDRYLELKDRDNLSAAEKTELEIEKCRFKRDLLARHSKDNRRAFENAEREYRRSCGDLLPR